MGPGTIGPWDHGTTGPWDQGQGTMGPWDHGTRDHGTMGPWDQGPWNQGPWDHGTMGPGTCELETKRFQARPGKRKVHELETSARYNKIGDGAFVPAACIIRVDMGLDVSTYSPA